MADQMTHVKPSVESDYAQCLLAVLPLFASNLPCYNYRSGQPDYYITEEHELRNLLSYIQFEIRLLHVTLTRAEAELGAIDAFVGCADVLRSHMNTLESLLQANTVKYISSLLPPIEETPEKTWLTALFKPRRLLDLFGNSLIKNQARSERNFHVKLHTLQDFLGQLKQSSADRDQSSHEDVNDPDCHSQEDTTRLAQEDVYSLVKLPRKLEGLRDKLGVLTTNNQVLELILSTRIPFLRGDPKSQKRRLRRMKNPEYRARDSGEQLYEALAGNWPNGPHVASLRLTPYWISDPSGSHGSVSFEVLLSTYSEPSNWQEAIFIADERYNASPGCFQVEDFCDFIQTLQQSPSTPYILLHKGRFFQTKSSRPRECNGCEPTLSLKKLLDEGFFDPGSKKIQLSTKRILAVILAHHLLQFAETLYLGNHWSSRNVSFLHRIQDGTLPNIQKPFFSTRINEDNLSGDTPTVDQHAFFRHPSIIGLGILLLEIETGKTMQEDKEDCDPKTGKPNINTRWTTAGKLLKSPEIQGSVYQDFRSVIEACLEPKMFLPDGLGFKDLNFREQVYKNIVAPLEDELLDGWPDLDIESLGIRRDFPIHGQSVAEPLSIGQVLSRGNTSHSLKAVGAKASTAQSKINGGPDAGVTRIPHPSLSESTELEAGNDPTISSMDMSNLPWWKNFKKTSEFMTDHRNDPSTIHTGKRVKVAILDTGYDRNDPLFREARESLPDIIGWQDFVAKERKPVDISGHGTRVAFFLLQMTTNIDLWIARVYENDEGTPESAKKVKTAIDEAIKLDVDIICMSLGFEKPIDEIEQSISAANTNGILVFAAASNNRELGSYYPVSFPASMEYGVFCINSHSPDHNPKWSSFNPDPRTKRPNFCIIGEGLYGPGSLPQIRLMESCRNLEDSRELLTLHQSPQELLPLFWSMVDHPIISKIGVGPRSESGNH